MTVAAAGCCCGGGVCFAKYRDCTGGFATVSIRYENGCPQVHPPVIYWLAGDPNHRCFYFEFEEPSASGAVILLPSQIVATFDDCETCTGNPPPPPTDTGACCHGEDGTLCTETTQVGCQQLNGTWFQGFNCTQVNCTTPIGACCYEDNLGGHCQNMTSAQCALLGGTWFPPPVNCATHQCQFGEGGESRGFGDTLLKVLRRIGIRT